MDPALTLKELAVIQTPIERLAVLANVGDALKARGIADPEFLERLGRCEALFTIPRLNPTHCALAIRILHEERVYGDQTRRRGRGRPSEPERDLIVGFLRVLKGGTLDLEIGERYRLTALICSQYFGREISADTVRRRATALRARFRKSWAKWRAKGEPPGEWPKGEYPD